MPQYKIDITTFWNDLGVEYCNTDATNMYDFFKDGLKFQGENELVYNFYEFVRYLGYDSQYQFFQNVILDYIGEVDSGIFDAFTFYSNVDDPNIIDRYTFWQYAPSYGTPFPQQLSNIVAMGQTTSSFWISFDNGETLNDTYVTPIVPLPSINMFVGSATNNGTDAAYFGTTNSANQSYIIRYDKTFNDYRAHGQYSGNRPFNSIVYLSDTLFYGVNSSVSNNLLKSVNDATTFSAITLSPAFRPEKIIWAPEENRLVIGGLGSTQRFLYSTNSGTTWTLSNTHTSITNTLTDLIYLKNSPIRKYIALFKNASGTQYIYNSVAGVSWKENIISTGSTMDLSCGAYDPVNNVFLAVSNSKTLGVISTDGGDTFTTITQPSKDFRQVIHIPGTTRFLAAYNGGVYWTDDNGTSWNDTFLNRDVRAITYLPL